MVNTPESTEEMAPVRRQKTIKGFWVCPGSCFWHHGRFQNTNTLYPSCNTGRSGGEGTTYLLRDMTLTKLRAADLAAWQFYFLPLHDASGGPTQCWLKIASQKLRGFYCKLLSLTHLKSLSLHTTNVGAARTLTSPWRTSHIHQTEDLQMLLLSMFV